MTIARFAVWLPALWPLMTGSCVLDVVVGGGPTEADGGAAEAWSGAPIDILFVVDNSGSMAWAHEHLAQKAASRTSSGSRCDALGYKTLVETLAVERPASRQDLSESMRAVFDACGMFERLWMFDSRFHIGVVSTDLSDCDDKTSFNDRGSIPQRGCLQTLPDADQDLVITWETPYADLAFAELIRNVGIDGSAYEKGLEAARLFLTPGHPVAPADSCDQPRDCSADLDMFRRASALDAEGIRQPSKLLIVFLTDEDDCSHGGSIDETQPGSTARCYESSPTLISTSSYSTFFRGLSPLADAVGVAAIGGFVPGSDGLVPSGCVAMGASISADCNPSHGNYVYSCDVCAGDHPVCSCHPDMTCGGIAFPATNCCMADPANRYAQVARAFEPHRLASICDQGFDAELAELVVEMIKPGF